MKFAQFGPQTVYRAVSLQFLRWVQSPKGSRIGAGRFNPVTTSAAYYAFDAGTAYAEVQQGAVEPLPLAIVAFEVSAKRLLDLRGKAYKKAPLSGWQDDWHAAQEGRAPTCPSWEVTKLALKENCSGIIYPSTQGAGTCLVLFPEDGTAGSFKIDVLDPHALIDKYAFRPLR